jgi:hypothetical protein
MSPSSAVTVFSRAQEFSEDFLADNGKLISRFCDHNINFQTKNTVTHITYSQQKKEENIATKLFEIRIDKEFFSGKRVLIIIDSSVVV